MAGPERPSPARSAADRLLEMSDDARAAVVLDAGGSLAGSSGIGDAAAERLAGLATELVEATDAAAADGPPDQVEARLERGAVYVVRRPQYTLAAVARRSALSSLMFYDVRAVLDELEAHS